MSDMNNPADDNNGAMDDLWAEALSEQKSTSGKSAADAVFQQFGGGDVSGTLQDIDLIMDIPVVDRRAGPHTNDHQRVIASDARISRGAGRSGGRTAGYSDQRLFNCSGRSCRSR